MVKTGSRLGNVACERETGQHPEALPERHRVSIRILSLSDPVSGSQLSTNSMKMEDFPFQMRFPYSPFSFLSITALLAFTVVASVPARAQGALHNDEVSISAFAQLTSDANGNGIKDTTTNSVGGQAAFRHSYKWWLGYEGSYAYTRYAETYTGQPFSFQHNMH